MPARLSLVRPQETAAAPPWRVRSRRQVLARQDGERCLPGVPVDLVDQARQRLVEALEPAPNLRWPAGAVVRVGGNVVNEPPFEQPRGETSYARAEAPRHRARGDRAKNALVDDGRERIPVADEGGASFGVREDRPEATPLEVEDRLWKVRRESRVRRLHQ